LQVKCAYVDQLVEACFHKWLPSAIMQDFDGHIALCPDCQARLKQYESELNQRLLGILSEEMEDADAVEELWARFLLEGKVVISPGSQSSS